MAKSLIVALALPACAAQAQPPPLPTILSPSQDLAGPQDPRRLQFFLITVAAGDEVWNNFGHTALRVIDDDTGSDQVFNWGVFDVSGGWARFSWNFFRGEARYRLAVWPTAAVLAGYRAERRGVWQERLNLTAAEKLALRRRLLWNLEPANLEYRYHYFTDNCTTRVRDYLDEATGGRLRADFADHLYTGTAPTASFEGDAVSLATAVPTYRGEALRHYRSRPWVGFSVDLLLNGRVDRVMSEWDSMFLPARLRANLLAMSASAAATGERASFLTDSRALMTFPEPAPRYRAHGVAGLALGLPTLALLLALARLREQSLTDRPRIGLRWPAVSYRVLGLLGMVTALASGAYGTLMTLGWLASSHGDLHGNLNLLLFWPTDLLCLAVTGFWLLRGAPWPVNQNAAAFVAWYLGARLLAMAAYGVIALAGISPQAVGGFAAYIVPPFFAYAVLVAMAGFRQSPTKLW